MKGFEDEIVITGISGRFPESANMNEFRDNLLNNINLITKNDRRFKNGIHGIPEGFGALKEIDKFDAEFFQVLPKQASRMDPQLRIALETTYEALIDAGVNPIEQRESKTGVYHASCGNEAFSLWNGRPAQVEGVTLTGCLVSMLANRVSFAYDFKGPSCIYDTACSSSMVALESAVSDIRSGKCDAAIVTGSSLILNPHTTLQFDKLGMLSKDSACKGFDISGNGYARAEAVVTIFIQKRSVARRVYGTIIHIKTNTDGLKTQGITYPSSASQEELLEDIYHEAGVNKADVKYIESHGTGTAVGDPHEFLALTRTFSETFSGRVKPLYIGTVKSNMGHTEGASGLCALAKLVIILQERIIPANLHYQNPHHGMKAIFDGNIQVVDKNIEWDGGLFGLNCFGFGGVNSHLILEPFQGNCNRGSTQNDREHEISKEVPMSVTLPKLITMSGRTEEGVESSLMAIGKYNDMNLNNLCNDCHRSNIPGHTFRGFSMPEFDLKRIEDLGSHNSIPEVWYIFNGIGSQWDGMGKDLLNIPKFAQSIQMSAQTLKTKFNYDLMSILNSTTGDDATNCFVSIAAIQIATVDVLSSLGIHPDGYIGHSAGEMVCAYVDGCLTAEETISCAYLRGSSLHSSDSSYGMAVIGASWDHVSSTCPEGIYPACHNGSSSVTVSGPKDLLQAYVLNMKEERRQAKEVNSCGIAFHSPYIESASASFLSSLSELITSPKARSLKWISSSIPKNEWSKPLALSASPKYFMNNFKSAVLFHDALQKIPESSVVIEIGPSGLLTGLIKLGSPTSTVIPTQRRDTKNGVFDLVSALGHMFINQVDININELYGKPDYPVPVGTPMLSPLIGWDHQASWDVPVYGKNGEFIEGTFKVDLSTDSDKYLYGHQLQGRVLFPISGYLLRVWQHFALSHQADFESFPVIFENVRCNRVTFLRSRGIVEFRVSISDTSGYFEVKEGGASIASGTIRTFVDTDDTKEYVISKDSFVQLYKDRDLFESDHLNQKKNMPSWTKEEVYKALRPLGYEYGEIFKGVKERDESGKYFHLEWNDNWVAFIDTMLHTKIDIFREAYQLELPTEIQKIVFSPKMFYEFIENNEAKDTNGRGLFTVYEKCTNVIRCTGVEVVGVQTRFVTMASKNEQIPELKTYTFYPYVSENTVQNQYEINDIDPIPHCVKIILENIKSHINIKYLEIGEFNQCPEESDSLQISKMILNDFTPQEFNYNFFTTADCSQDLIDKFSKACINFSDVETMSRNISMIDQKFDIIILDNHQYLRLANDYIRKAGFLLLKFQLNTMSRDSIIEKLGPKFNLIAHKSSRNHDVFLIRRAKSQDLKTIKVIEITSSDFIWVTTLKQAIMEQEELTKKNLPQPLIYLVSNGVEHSGILGLTNCLRQEPFCHTIRTIFSKKMITLDFENPNHMLNQILTQDSVINVINEDGQLGSYEHSGISKHAMVTHCENVFLGMRLYGDLSTLCWIQGNSFNERECTASDRYISVKVHIAALNFKDIMLASGRLKPDKKWMGSLGMESPLGMEFSGVTKNGQRVFGFTEGQALASNVTANLDWVWDIPKVWSFEEAATVPVVYSTVYFALFMRGNIKPGESILIHAGAGGVGLAAIRVALNMKCQIFTTVGSDEKVDFIRKEYPEIPEENIGCSRDTSFEQMVMIRTGGRGVDLILNSLSGDKLDASVRCLARHGRFLEIGKVDLISNKALGMSVFAKDASYHGVMLDSLWDAPPSIRKHLKELIQIGLDNEVIKPLPFRKFTHEQAEPAFRYMGQGSHIGKVLLGFDKDEQFTSIQATPRVYFHPYKSYIVIGGLGGVGLEFINWMTIRGAKNIILTSRRGLVNSYQEHYVQKWKRLEVSIKVLKLDASKIENAKILIQEAEELGPVGGIFNLAMHIVLGLMKTQSEKSFTSVMDPKVKLTKNLDELTRQKCLELDHFIVFSSVAAGFGIDGQANYGMANSSAEQIIEKRFQDGLPGKAIQLGPIGDVGAFYEEYNLDFSRESFKGLGIQSIASTIKSLDVLFHIPTPIVLSSVVLDTIGKGNSFKTQNLGIVDRVARILGHAEGSHKLSANAKLTELGMDSVVSMEVRQILEQDFNLNLSAAEIQNCTLKELEEMSKNTSLNSTTLSKPKLQPSTSTLFQLNFVKSLSRSRFTHEKCVYPINNLAIKRMNGEREDVEDGRGKGSVFIINSIEGPEVVTPLGNLIHLPTYAMQFTQEAPSDNFDSLTDYYYANLRATEPHGPYIIVGYSAGSFVGINLAFRLQKTDEIEKLYLLDMTPARFEAIVQENFGKYHDDIDLLDILMVMSTQVFGFDRNVVEALFRKERDPEKRLKKIKEMFSSFIGEEIEVDAFQEVMTERGHLVTQLYKNYKITDTYHGRIFLLKTNQNLISYDSEEFWGVEKFCTQTPIVHIFDTTHSYMLAEPMVRKVAVSINYE